MTPLRALQLRRRIWPLAALPALLIIILTIGAYEAYAQSPPATPTSVTLTRSDGTVTASWPAVSGATSYHITYSSDGAQSWSLAALNHAATTITIIGADNHKSYVVAVRARNSAGDSGWRNSDSIAVSAPGTPSSVTLTRANGSLSASWPAVSGATGYHVTYSSDGGWTWSLVALNHTANSITFSGVDNYKSYVVAVRAKNAFGGGDWRNSDSIAPLYPPGQVGNLSATRSGTGISVTWNAPASDGGSAVTGYDVNYSSDGGHSWTRAVSGTTGATATVSDASNAVAYDIAVRANNAIGSGGWARSDTVYGLAAPDSVKAYKDKDHRFIDAEWTAVAGATGYDVNLIFKGLWHYRKADNVTGTSYRISDGVFYYAARHFTVAVRARNAHGPGPWTNSAPAAASLTLAASGVSTSTATLTLSPYTGAWWLKRTSPADTTCKSKGTASTESLTGLTPGATYTYKAYSDDGCANELATETFTTNRLAVSVSNLDKPPYSYFGFRADVWRAVGFTTGTSTAGYTLTEVTARFADKINPYNTLGDIVVSLHADNSGVPASATLATLSGDNPDTAGDYDYTCSGSGCALATSTTYFIQFKAAAGTDNDDYYALRSTESDDETQVPSGNGWSLANETDVYFGFSGGWTTPYDDTGYLKVSAAVNPP